jgi:hypothetical protein
MVKGGRRHWWVFLGSRSLQYKVVATNVEEEQKVVSENTESGEGDEPVGVRKKRKMELGCSKFAERGGGR